MRIGVNALYLIPGGVGGTEIYLRNLLRALAALDRTNEYFIITNRETADLTPSAPNFHTLPQPIAARIRPLRIAWEQAALPLQRFDVLLNPGFTAPLFARCPQVTVFHDLQHVRHPEFFRWYDLPFWRFLLWGSVRRSQALIAVSEATRRDLMAHYGVDATVISHGVEPEIFALRREPERFILCVSTLHPHKGIDGLLRAFAGFHARHPEFRLVLAGMRGFHAAGIEAAAGEGVEITGWIPRAQLIDLYRRAWAFVYPSTFEGFGMPVAEAMAAGIPVACSAIEPLREVAGDAALFFPPGEPELERIGFDDDLRVRLSAAGRDRAVRFSWSAAAEQTLAVLLRAGAG
jgi:glycosyltransferase involved in cell wall biosynthesis